MSKSTALSQGLYTQDKIRLMAQQYVLRGMSSELCSELCISPADFSYWLRSPQGMTAVREARARGDSILDAALSEIITDATSAVKRVLTEGETVLDKYGELRTVPVSGNVAAKILATAFQTRQLVRRAPTQIADVDEKLLELADKLRNIGRPTTTYEAVQTDNGEVVVDNTDDEVDNEKGMENGMEKGM